jgi:hypothetical protein
VAAFFWPGVAMYDTVAQYGQVLSNDVDDWHPPVMVRMWQLLHPLGPTTTPMFVLQVALYASGFALIVAALVSHNRPRAGLAAGVLALSPLLLGWQLVVLKDAQMLGALVVVAGIAARYRLAARPIPVWAGAIVALLLAYATLLRSNALFATVPLTVVLLARPSSIVSKSVLAVGAVLVLIGATPLINQQLFDAAPSGVAKSQPLFDLAAIAVATPGSVKPFTPAEAAELSRRHCVKAFFWDPIADPSACGPVSHRANAVSERILYFDLAAAAVTHPISYAAHRLEHWNSTERWLVQPGLIGAEPPDEAEPNSIGLSSPQSPIVAAWQSVAGIEVATPVGWPITWTVLALLLVPTAWRRRKDASGGLALALLLSALTLEASFLVISIASDLRYHLWPMAASALALILLSDDPQLSRRALGVVITALLIVTGGGIVARASLPPAPDSYQGMIHAAAE